MNHGHLGQKSIIAITVEVDLRSLARNLAINGTGGKMDPRLKFHGWCRQSTPAAVGYNVLARNLGHLAFIGLAVRSMSGTPQVCVRSEKAWKVRSHSLFEMKVLLRSSVKWFWTTGT